MHEPKETFLSILLAALGGGVITALLDSLFFGRSKIRATNTEAELNEDQIRKELWGQIMTVLNQHKETISAIEAELEQAEREAHQLRVQRIEEKRAHSAQIFELEEKLRKAQRRVAELEEQIGGS